VLLLGAAAEPRWIALNRAAGEASRAKDYAKLRDALVAMEPLLPGNSRIVYNLACAYARFGQLLGVELVEHPDLALEPALAARILAYDFMLKGVPKAAADGDWVKVRRLAHGDLSGWKRFNGILIPLLKLLP